MNNNNEPSDSIRKRSPLDRNGDKFNQETKEKMLQGAGDISFSSVGWRSNCCHFKALPEWLQDNNYLLHQHRRPLPSIWGCIKSIFHLHTETGNIWTHLLPCLGFTILAIWFNFISNELEEKLIFSIFFSGVILCLLFSSAFHTFCCHSPSVSKTFQKLDYVGITMLIMSSMIPAIHYSFYSQLTIKYSYILATFVLGTSTIIFSLYDKFATPLYRSVRAGLFIVFGLSGAFPALHFLALNGWSHAISRGSLLYLILMGFLYILGALLYANRIPERFFPGKCDIWFQSHQLFHILVVAAAAVHFVGLYQMALNGQIDRENLKLVTSSSGQN